MAFNITCKLLAALFVVGYANAASSGKAVRLLFVLHMRFKLYKEDFAANGPVLMLPKRLGKSAYRQQIPILLSHDGMVVKMHSYCMIVALPPAFLQPAEVGYTQNNRPSSRSFRVISPAMYIRYGIASPPSHHMQLE